jgi:hypothetical protein
VQLTSGALLDNSEVANRNRNPFSQGSSRREAIMETVIKSACVIEGSLAGHKPAGGLVRRHAGRGKGR